MNVLTKTVVWTMGDFLYIYIYIAILSLSLFVRSCSKIRIHVSHTSLFLKDWRDLARKLGLDKYIQLLEGRSPHSTRLLLLKWGEKPRWTVDSLLYALSGIGRVDVANFIRARMGFSK